MNQYKDHEVFINFLLKFKQYIRYKYIIYLNIKDDSIFETIMKYMRENVEISLEIPISINNKPINIYQFFKTDNLNNYKSIRLDQDKLKSTKIMQFAIIENIANLYDDIDMSQYEKGSFLLRKSKTVKDTYVLSYVINENDNNNIYFNDLSTFVHAFFYEKYKQMIIYKFNKDKNV